jgi:ABC-2 type transport system permease protein
VTRAAGGTTATGGGAVPARAAAPALRRVAAQARFEAAALLRNGEQLLVAVVLPVMALVGLAATTVPTLGPGPRVDVAVAGVLALSVVSTAFTGQAIATGFDRRYGVLRMLGSTPLGRRGLIAAKALAVLAVQALQFLVVGGIGLALGWQPHWSGMPAALVSVVLGTWALVACALLLAGTVRAEGVLALANLVWVALVTAGGVLVPSAELPGALAPLAAALPSGALGDGLRSALVTGRADLAAWLVLAAWGVGATALASRLFRWGD